MKKDIHPTYQKVLFVDSASGHRFVCGSTLHPEARETFEGVEYPVSYLSISSSSHPFFTGSKQLLDSEGRVEKFKKRFGRKQEVVKEESSHEEKEQQQPAGKKAAEKKGAKTTKKRA
jgi:large subunit ribosomal protein L31